MTLCDLNRYANLKRNWGGKTSHNWRTTTEYKNMTTVKASSIINSKISIKVNTFFGAMQWLEDNQGDTTHVLPVIFSDKTTGTVKTLIDMMVKDKIIAPRTTLQQEINEFPTIQC